MKSINIDMIRCVTCDFAKLKCNDNSIKQIIETNLCCVRTYLKLTFYGLLIIRLEKEEKFTWERVRGLFRLPSLVSSSLKEPSHVLLILKS